MDFSFPVYKKGSVERTQSRYILCQVHYVETHNTASRGAWCSEEYPPETVWGDFPHQPHKELWWRLCQPPLWRLRHYRLFPLNFYFGFIYFIVCLCFACTYVWAPHAGPGTCGGQDRSLDSVVSHLVGAGNWAQVLCKSNKYSWALGHLPRLIVSPFYLSVGLGPPQEVTPP